MTPGMRSLEDWIYCFHTGASLGFLHHNILHPRPHSCSSSLRSLTVVCGTVFFLFVIFLRYYLLFSMMIWSDELDPTLRHSRTISSTRDHLQRCFWQMRLQSVPCAFWDGPRKRGRRLWRNCSFMMCHVAKEPQVTARSAIGRFSGRCVKRKPGRARRFLNLAPPLSDRVY